MSLLLVLLQSSNNAADEFVARDPFGVGMAIIAMLVVLSVLAISAIVFQNIDNLIHFFTNVFKKKSEVVEETGTKVSSGDEIAAIALALHMYKSELHDAESLTLTFNRISRTYSPWSSKIYGVINKATNKNPYTK
ncbi:MAG TPA: OadG family protein [Tenuifilaceae bacterium]|nr:OadG family protein [Tenuifilaceae bacterium]HPE18011.1 OadG family protein [Tenuifilaceae bacterium]HPJ44868.1 OadG family protein [Tenuifilaceae bacterium]HPQ33165.1 OadG family protein [Tenuifilaceae bacterium]HRX67099.1 OadG family protein [Tenuifilaceae bacterium]